MKQKLKSLQIRMLLPVIAMTLLIPPCFPAPTSA